MSKYRMMLASASLGKRYIVNLSSNRLPSEAEASIKQMLVKPTKIGYLYE